MLLACAQRSFKSRFFTSSGSPVQSPSMQVALLYRSVPALTAVYGGRSITNLRFGRFNSPGTFEPPFRSFARVVRRLSTTSEAPCTDLGAGLPEIIETSNVPVRPPGYLGASFIS